MDKSMEDELAVMHRGDEIADKIRAKTEELIALVKDNAKDPRRAALAATNYEQAAMWAVKAMY